MVDHCAHERGEWDHQNHELVAGVILNDVTSDFRRNVQEIQIRPKEDGDSSKDREAGCCHEDYSHPEEAGSVACVEHSQRGVVAERKPDREH